MKHITLALIASGLFSGLACAGETLDAAAVKKLITGNTVEGLSPNGVTQRNYFAPDGTTIRQIDGQADLLEGTWSVKDDGAQCVQGMSGGCATIVRNDDGTYDRIVKGGNVRLKWVTVKPGKSF